MASIVQYVIAVPASHAKSFKEVIPTGEYPTFGHELITRTEDHGNLHGFMIGEWMRLNGRSFNPYFIASFVFLSEDLLDRLEERVALDLVVPSEGPFWTATVVDRRNDDFKWIADARSAQSNGLHVYYTCDIDVSPVDCTIVNKANATV